MSDLRTAAQQALEALRKGVRAINHLGGAREAVPLHDAIDALRAALEQPDVPEADFGNMEQATVKETVEPAQPATTEESSAVDPVAYSIGRTLHWHPGRGVVDAQLYAAPAQREPLTDADIDAVCAGIECSNTDLGVYDRLIARAIERAHGISEPKDAG